MSEIIRAVETRRPQVQLVYFDLGGVVFNFSGGLAAISHTLQIPEEQVMSMWKSCDDAICKGELTPQDFWRLVNNHFGTNVELDFLTFWMDHFTPIDHTHESMRQMSDAGMEIGILTNIYPGVFEHALERQLIPDLPYRSVVQSCNIGLVKPDPLIFKYAAETSGFKAHEVMLIDDRNENIQAAEAAGWSSFQFSQK